MAILFGPIAIGLVLSFLMFYAWSAPRGFSRFVLIVYGLGLLLFLSAKISQIRRGVLLSFGSSRMSVSARRAYYRAGYFLMFFGLAATFALVKVLTSNLGVP
jgi:hypothetical protein